MAKVRSTIQIKRVYEAPASDDGFRVLIDRLWPRGMTHARAKVDAWPKVVAPSTELRLWFRHDPKHWEEFRRRYKAELADNPALDDLRALLHGHKRVTLLYGARVTDCNHAIVLRDVLAPERLRSGGRRK